MNSGEFGLGASTDLTQKVSRPKDDVIRQQASGFSTMNEVRNCEQCGATLDSSAPEGLCPRCVLATVGNIRLDDSVSERGLDKAANSDKKTLAVPAADTLTDLTGTTIGRYKLLQQIGEGGFGIVFMAEQLEPVQRKVALKVIKAGMDTREVIARFEAER